MFGLADPRRMSARISSRHDDGTLTGRSACSLDPGEVPCPASRMRNLTLMPTLTGMKLEGFYDRNSAQQRGTMQAVIGWLTEAIGTMTLPGEAQSIVAADFGCSEGRNSIIAMGHIVEALRDRRHEQPICIVHCDLPSNNFNQLFRALYDPAQSSYAQTRGHRRANIVPLACGGSFFDPMLAPRSLSIAMSVVSVQWMDRVPDVPIPEFIGYLKASSAAREAYARQADEEMTRFLEARALELVPGGKLLVVAPGSDGAWRGGDGIYDVLNDAALDLVDAGRISRRRFESFVMPIYYRTIEEMTVPLTRPGSPVGGAFQVDRIETLELAMPFEDELRRTGHVETYADGYTNAVRAFSEPVLTGGLVEPGQDRTVIDELYARVRARLVTDPQRYTTRDIEVAMLLTRRS